MQLDEAQATAALVGLRLAHQADGTFSVEYHDFKATGDTVHIQAKLEEVPDETLKAWLLYIVKLYKKGVLPSNITFPLHANQGIQTSDA